VNRQPSSTAAPRWASTTAAAASAWPHIAAALSTPLLCRVCGSPAVEAYAHVNVSCILQSPTARWYRQYIAAGGSYHDLVVHIEPQADYDGIAVKWGINHKTATAQVRSYAVAAALLLSFPYCYSLAKAAAMTKRTNSINPMSVPAVALPALPACQGIATRHRATRCNSGIKQPSKHSS
jgi:hypothetical protein